MKTKIKSIAAMLSIISITASSQIIYTDVNDTTIYGTPTSGGFYFLDLNTDFTIDYVFTAAFDPSNKSAHIFGSTQPVFTTTKQNTFDSINPTSPSMINVFAHNQTTNIGPSITWCKNAETGALTSQMLYGFMGMQFKIAKFDSGVAKYNWSGVNDKFLALKFVIDSGYHYGWLRMDVASDASWFRIKDFAYNSQPDQPISAGQTNNGMLGITQTENNKAFSLFPNPTNGMLGIKSADINEDFVVTDLSGKEILEFPITLQQQTIDCTILKSGVYLLRNKETQQTIRFIKQ